MNLIQNGEIPMGFGMALAENLEAMAVFSQLSPQQQKQILDGTRNIRSKKEMQAYVERLRTQA